MFGGKAPDALPEPRHICGNPRQVPVMQGAARRFGIGRYLRVPYVEPNMNHDRAITVASRCHLCFEPSSAFVELDGHAVCDVCLRRMNASPREKRAILFSATL